MTMTIWQGAITIVTVVLGTMCTRFLPFLVFPESKQPLHVWKRNMLLSIAGGTIVYMLLVQLVF